MPRKPMWTITSLPLFLFATALLIIVLARLLDCMNCMTCKRLICFADPGQSVQLEFLIRQWRAGCIVPFHCIERALGLLDND